ncbi:MAG: hypothetical protein IH607_03035, partial [Firmicutes bacterium]|nr:hypothetical protein [Bacillota bacterium]
MKQKITALLIFLFSLLTVAFMIAQVVAFQTRTEAPVAHEGVLELSAFDISRQGSLPLNGDWKFFDGQFLTQNDLASGAYDSLARMVSVPGKRNDYPRQGNEPAAYGYGTYALKMLLGDNVLEDWAIKTSNIGMAHIL